MSTVVALLGGELTAPGLGADAAIPALLDLLLLFRLREWLTEQPDCGTTGGARH